jgi:diacylglycerol O-acyltransferase
MAAARLRRDHLSPMDALVLHMDRPTNLVMVTGVLLFDELLDFERLKATVERRLLAYERFRQRVRESRSPIGLPHWETDPYFDIAAHVHRIALPAPGDRVALQALVSDLLAVPLDFSMPPWQIHLVENYGAGCALIMRLHHCIADGLALVQVLLSLADRAPDAPWPEPLEETPRPWNPIEAILGPMVGAYDAASSAIHGAETVLHEGWETLTDPARRLEAAMVAASGARSLGKLALSPPDRHTAFQGPCGIPKRGVWSDPIALSDIKAIGKTLDATVNDVMLAAVAGALGSYLRARGESTDGLDIRVYVPVNARKPGEEVLLGNRIGAVFLSLPLGIEDPHERVVELKRRMDAIKASPEAVLLSGVLSGVGLTPVQVKRVLGNLIAAKATAVMTNVIGPREALYLAGAPIRDLMFWVPVPAGLGLGISILSYAGRVTLGITTDAGLVPDPEVILAAFRTDLEAMKSWVPAGATPQS